MWSRHQKKDILKEFATSNSTRGWSVQSPYWPQSGCWTLGFASWRNRSTSADLSSLSHLTQPIILNLSFAARLTTAMVAMTQLLAITPMNRQVDSDFTASRYPNTWSTSATLRNWFNGPWIESKMQLNLSSPRKKCSKLNYKKTIKVWILNFGPDWNRYDKNDLKYSTNALN